MKILVKAKPGAKKEEVVLVSQSALDFDPSKQELPVYKISVKEPPIGGRANEAIKSAIADYFDVTVSQVILLSGKVSRQKLFEIKK